MPEPVPTLPSSRSPLAALTFPHFRVYWAGSAVSWAGTSMQQVAVAWQVYALTHSPVALGLTGLFRVIPVLLLSLGAGVVADVIDRRRLLLVTQVVLLSMSAALAVLTFSHAVSIWWIYGIITLASSARAFNGPAQQAVIPGLVPRQILANALSINNTAQQVATVLGPTVAGLLIAVWGVGIVYTIDAVSYFAVVTALILIRLPPVENAIQEISISAALDGLRFVFTTPIIFSTMGLDFVATFFSSATLLLPIFATNILAVGSRGYGLLSAAPSIGAVLAGLIMSMLGLRIRSQGLVIIWAVAAYGLATLVFGLSHSFWLSMVALAGTGAADTVSMILRQTIRQINTPDAMRGRMTAVGMVFFMGGPQLGELEAGLMARAYGAVFSVVSGGVATLIATGLIGAMARRLRHYTA